MDWQPIETAPKDGPILVFIPYSDEGGEPGYQLVAEWAGPNMRWCDTARGSWYGFTPTHWMPLPEPPKAGEE